MLKMESVFTWDLFLFHYLDLENAICLHSLIYSLLASKWWCVVRVGERKLSIFGRCIIPKMLLQLTEIKSILARTKKTGRGVELITSIFVWENPHHHQNKTKGNGLQLQFMGSIYVISARVVVIHENILCSKAFGTENGKKTQFLVPALAWSNVQDMIWIINIHIIEPRQWNGMWQVKKLFFLHPYITKLCSIFLNIYNIQLAKSFFQTAWDNRRNSKRLLFIFPFSSFWNQNRISFVDDLL